ncbi:MAG: hypothetical protein WCO30_00545 [bacterium]
MKSPHAKDGLIREWNSGKLVSRTGIKPGMIISFDGHAMQLYIEKPSSSPIKLMVNGDDKVYIGENKTVRYFEDVVMVLAKLHCLEVRRIDEMFGTHLSTYKFSKIVR